MTDRFEGAAREAAFQIMLDIANEWHQQIGIDEVMKTKLTRKIADTVATGVVTRHLTVSLRLAHNAALEEAAHIADHRLAMSQYHPAAKNAGIVIAEAVRALKVQQR